MSPFVWALGGLVLIGAYLAIIKPKLDSENRKREIQTKCADLKRQIARAELAGQDTNLLAILQADYRACLEEAGESGIDIDISKTYVDEMESLAAKMRTAFSDYTRTSYSDPVTRDNKRGAIFFAASQFLESGEDFINSVPPPSSQSKERALRIISQAIKDSFSRVNCYCLNGNCNKAGPGCGRFALNETDQKTRAENERDQVYEPLNALKRRIAAVPTRKAEKK